MAEQEREPGLLVVAVREWWNPAGHMITTARAFDANTGRVLVVFPDGHGTGAVAAEVSRQWDLPAGVRFAWDVVRVARRRDLHQDPHKTGMGRESLIYGTVTA